MPVISMALPLGRRGLVRFSQFGQTSAFFRQLTLNKQFSISTVNQSINQRPQLLTVANQSINQPLQSSIAVNQSIKQRPQLLIENFKPVFSFRFRKFSSSAVNFSSAENQIKSILQEKFPQASEIHVEDVSGGCGSMFQIYIEAEEFRGKKLVEQQRMVNSVLEKEIKEMHGLSLHTAVPPKPRTK